MRQEVARSLARDVRGWWFGELQCVPLPLDHFFFCFFAPELAAGAIFADLKKTLSLCPGVVLIQR